MNQAFYNPFLPEFVADPRAMLHRLRAHEPVHFASLISVWIISSYQHVLEAQHDERLSAASKHWDRYQGYFVRGGGQSSAISKMHDGWMLQRDPPDHTRLRALLNTAFTPRAVEAMRPRIRQIANEILDRFIGAGEMDFCEDLAFPLPIAVICDMMGLPREDYEKIKNWSTAILPVFSPSLSLKSWSEITTALNECRAYFFEQFERKRREPKDDLLTALLAAYERGDRLDDDELLGTALLLVFAGHATTVQLLSGGLELLIRHSDQRQFLMSDPSLINSAVEECLRYVSPLQQIYRSTKEDVEIGGKRIPKGQMVFLSLIGANFDPAQFPDPDRFDITRAPNRHQAFGHGIHYCAGAPLSRLEAQITFPIVLERLKNLEIAGPVKRESSLLLRGITSLPLKFKA